MVRRQGDGFLLLNLARAHADRLNGRPIGEMAQLADGDKLTIGRAEINFHWRVRRGD